MSQLVYVVQKVEDGNNVNYTYVSGIVGATGATGPAGSGSSMTKSSYVPDLQAGSGNPTLTYVSRSGSYSVNGSICFFNVDMDVTVDGSFSKPLVTLPVQASQGNYTVGNFNFGPIHGNAVIASNNLNVVECQQLPASDVSISNNSTYRISISGFYYI